MTLDITTISFIIGGLLVAIGILGGGLEIKELKVPKLNNSSRILAVTGGLAFLVLGIYMSAPVPNEKSHTYNETPYKSDVCSISVYSVPNNAVKNVPEGSICNIRITCGGFNSQTEADQGLSEIFFSVKLNGEGLEAQGGPGIIQDSNGWHVYQDYRTYTFQKGVDYRLTGITYRRPNQYVDSREFTIRSK